MIDTESSSAFQLIMICFYIIHISIFFWVNNLINHNYFTHGKIDICDCCDWINNWFTGNRFHFERWNSLKIFILGMLSTGNSNSRFLIVHCKRMLVIQWSWLSWNVSYFSWNGNSNRIWPVINIWINDMANEYFGNNLPHAPNIQFQGAFTISGPVPISIYEQICLFAFAFCFSSKRILLRYVHDASSCIY